MAHRHPIARVVYTTDVIAPCSSQRLREHTPQEYSWRLAHGRTSGLLNRRRAVSASFPTCPSASFAKRHSSSGHATAYEPRYMPTRPYSCPPQPWSHRALLALLARAAAPLHTASHSLTHSLSPPTDIHPYIHAYIHTYVFGTYVRTYNTTRHYLPAHAFSSHPNPAHPLILPPTVTTAHSSSRPPASSNPRRAGDARQPLAPYTIGGPRGAPLPFNLSAISDRADESGVPRSFCSSRTAAASLS